MAGRLDEADTPLSVGEVVTGKVIGLKKQEHSGAALIADRIALSVAYSPRQQQSARCAVRRDYDPPFASVSAVPSRNSKPSVPTKKAMAVSYSSTRRAVRFKRWGIR